MRTRLVFIGLLMFVLAACGGDDPADDLAAPDDPAGDEDEDDGQDVDDSDDEFPNVVDGVLQPLADGFPSQPITLWNAWEPGNDDDVLNQTIARIGAEYAPVNVVTDTQQMGPALHYELVTYLEDRPGADEGYHIYATSWFGLGTRAFTLDALADVPFDELYNRLNPINRMMAAPFAIFSNADGPYETLEDVEDYLRENPGDLILSGAAPGSGTHSTVMVWAEQAGIEFTYLPGDSSAEIRQLVLGGGADLGISPLQPGDADQFHVLMTSGDSVLAGFDDVPSAGDLGYTIPSGSETGYGTLPGIPDPHLQWLIEWLRLVSEDPEFQEAYADFDTTYRVPDEVERDRQGIVEYFVPVLEEQGLVVRDDY